MNFNALSFGSDGILDASNPITTMSALTSGALNWPIPTPPNSPAVAPRAIDDLWHATVNGRGVFVYAKSPIEVSYGFGNIISGISNNRKARVGGALLHQQLSATNNFLFQATIEPGWAGELKKAFINPVDGSFVSFGWGNKGAGAILNTQLATPAPVTSPALDSNNAWNLNRRIVTRNVDNALYPPTVVPFTYAALNIGAATQLNTLSTDPCSSRRSSRICGADPRSVPGPPRR